jgi:hypothetical protein
MDSATSSTAVSPLRPRVEPEERPRWSLTEYLIGLACRMLVLFGFYTLSIGPMYWRWYSGKYVNGSAVIAAFYEPLWILAGECPWFGDWVNAYIQLWQG